MIALYPYEMRFHESWDWLFVVLRKIEKQGCIINIDLCFTFTCRICKIGKKNEKVINFYSEYEDIEGVYDCVIQYIKYYNDSKKRNESPS